MPLSRNRTRTISSLILATLMTCATAPPAQTQLASPSTFEVAVLKPDKSDSGVMGGCHGIDSKSPDDSRFPVPLGRCVIIGGRLSHMMSLAYGMSMQRISGFPDWDGPSRWSVQAEAENPQSATDAQLRAMFQNFLVEQFRLKLRHDKKEMPSFMLVVGKNLKIKPSQQDSMTMQPAVGGKLVWKGCSMKDLADFLSGLPAVDRPVVDRTNLPGRYDFTLDIFGKEVEDPIQMKQGIEDWESVFQDIKSQLGLKLDSGRSVVDTLVIESAEKPQN